MSHQHSKAPIAGPDVEETLATSPFSFTFLLPCPFLKMSEQYAWSLISHYFTGGSENRELEELTPRIHLRDKLSLKKQTTFESEMFSPGLQHT